MVGVGAAVVGVGAAVAVVGVVMIAVGSGGGSKSRGSGGGTGTRLLLLASSFATPSKWRMAVFSVQLATPVFQPATRRPPVPMPAWELGMGVVEEPAMLRVNGG